MALTPAINATDRARQTPRTWSWVSFAAGGLSVGLAVIALGGLLFARSGQPSHVAQRPLASASPQRQAAQRDGYVKVIAPDVDATTAGLRGITQPCQAHFNRRDCPAAAQTALHQTIRTLSDLDRTPAPDCLRLADSELRFALELFREGEIMLVSAVDTDFQPSMDAGFEKLNEGTAHLNSSLALGNQAYCSPDR